MDEFEEIIPEPLDLKLKETVASLAIILEAEPSDDNGFFAQGKTEAYIVDVLETREVIIAKALSMGIKLMQGTIANIPNQDDSTAQLFTILAVSCETPNIVILTGTCETDEEVITCIEKDYPGEHVFFLLELHPESDYLFEAEPIEKGSDYLEIYVNSQEHILAILN